MGKTEINDRIGLYEDIGPVADSNQATCLRSGCTKTISECVRNSDIPKQSLLFFFSLDSITTHIC